MGRDVRGASSDLERIGSGSSRVERRVGAAATGRYRPAQQRQRSRSALSPPSCSRQRPRWTGSAVTSPVPGLIVPPPRSILLPTTLTDRGEGHNALLRTSDGGVLNRG